MLALVKVLKDQKPVNLLFETKEQAQAFIDFVHLYTQECCPGNGYDTYRHEKDEPIVEVDNPVESARDWLILDVIESMAYSIWRKRLALPDWVLMKRVNEYKSCVPQCGGRKGGIVFVFNKGKLPPRLRPNVGDLATIVDHPDYDRVIAIVKEIKCGVVTLFKAKYLGATEGETIEVPVSNVMKIYNPFIRGFYGGQ